MAFFGLYFSMKLSCFYNMGRSVIESMGYPKSFAGGMLTLFTFIQIPVSLVLPILIGRFPNGQETRSTDAASAWSAMLQSGGYVIGSSGPVLVGWLRDTTGNLIYAFGGMSIFIVLPIVLLFIIGNKKEHQSAEGIVRDALNSEGLN